MTTSRFLPVISIVIVAIALPITIYLVERPQLTQQQAANNSMDCDINGDGQVNHTDYDALITCIQGSLKCGAAEKDRADLDKNGIVDSRDLNIYLRKCKE